MIHPYMPNLLTDKELAVTIVPSLKAILVNLFCQVREMTNKESMQHHLILGTKGSGKTHLLQFLMRKVKKELKNWIVVWIPVGIGSGIFNQLDLLTKICNTICEKTMDNSLMKKIENTKNLHIEQRIDLIWAYLEDYCQVIKILLIVEDFEIIFGKRLMKERTNENTIRSQLMTSKSILLIGATSYDFEQITKHKHPFWGLCAIVKFHQFSFDEIIFMLRNKSQVDKNNFSSLMDGQRDKFYDLYQNLGGNPRYWIKLYDIVVSFGINEMQKLLAEALMVDANQILNNFSFLERKIIMTIVKSENELRPSRIVKNIDGESERFLTTILARLFKNPKTFSNIAKRQINCKKVYYCLHEESKILSFVTKQI